MPQAVQQLHRCADITVMDKDANTRAPEKLLVLVAQRPRNLGASGQRCRHVADLVQQLVQRKRCHVCEVRRKSPVTSNNLPLLK